MDKIQEGSCYVARRTGNKYIFVGIDENDPKRGIIYFPFFGIRGTSGTLPLSSIMEDENLNIILSLPLDGSEIISKLA